MPTTPIYALPYQGLTEQPNGPVLGEELALAVEAQLARIDGVTEDLNNRAILRSVGYTTSTNVVINAGAAAVVASRTFTAVSGWTYLMTVSFRISGSDAGSQATIEGRYAAGSTILTSSPQMPHIETFKVVTASLQTHVVYISEFVAPASGNVTAGLTINHFSGLGSVTVPRGASDKVRVAITLGIPT